MQHDIAAIKDGFPEGVWLNAVFRFLFERGYLTVVFQDDDVFTTSQMGLREVGDDSGGKFPAERGLHRITHKLNPHSLAKHNSMITITFQRNGTSQIQQTSH